jgi:hypothetical protein
MDGPPSAKETPGGLLGLHCFERFELAEVLYLAPVRFSR